MYSHYNYIYENKSKLLKVKLLNFFRLNLIFIFFNFIKGVKIKKKLMGSV